jgi:hypothetical protein
MSENRSIDRLHPRADHASFTGYVKISTMSVAGASGKDDAIALIALIGREGGAT